MQLFKKNPLSKPSNVFVIENQGNRVDILIQIWRKKSD